MDPAAVEGVQAARPAVVLPAFEGPLDLLLHLVRENKVSIWDIPIARICDQYHAVLERMEELDLELAGEFLVTASWLLAIKSRLLLPRPEGEDDDPRAELVERLIEYEKVKRTAAVLAGIEEVRRGIEAVSLEAPEAPSERELDLADVDIIALGQALRALLERHRREHPPAMEVPPMRYSVREKIVELFDLVTRQRSFPLLSHLLTRPERLESVTFLVAALELVRLGSAEMHQRQAFAEIHLTATGTPLAMEALGDV
ncbi:MAG: segregation/condensation protein A [Thermoanaerobaculaceae bacterium]|nr:segregation/condensation protein A [Thermoanaerobaculaceae bacterium]MDI9622023.1 segregation/condensation protein A [Acidobacteriota bacterium]NLH11759.1 segregation/condensation protein A [Holophagae bacterium]HPW54813.1 segregation/condensation protein A [Thermoanaerobaculaceae bacterium]